MSGLFTNELLRRIAVWQKAQIVQGRSPDDWRSDDYGSLIHWDAYGDTRSAYGWQIDHILPSALGGSDDLRNLRALHHRRNASLGGLLSSMMDLHND